MNPNETVIDPVAKTVTIPLPTYIQMTRGSYGNNGLAAEERDDFVMYVYKIKRCPQKLPHNWTDCPYAHRGEKAKRRDPRKFPYQGTACLEWKQSEDCTKGKNCEYAHGVFEYWLHPTRYRTKVCEEGLCCTRKICFFAHTAQQLRRIAVPIYGRGGSHEIKKPMTASQDSVSFPVPVPVPVPAGGSSSSWATIPNPCRGCGANVVTRDNNKMSYFGHGMTTEEVVAQRYRYCKECIDAAERAAIVAMTTHAFAAPMTGRQRGRGDYVALPPLMASPAAPDGGPSPIEELEDLCGLPDLHWVQDLIN